MRVALVSQEFPPETAHGGIATQTLRKARGLAALGHDVVVVSHAVADARTDVERDGFRLVRLPGPAGSRAAASEPERWIAWSAIVAAELRTLHRDRALDVVDFAEYGAEGLVFLRTRGATGPRAVVQLHGPLAMLARVLGWPEEGTELHRVGIAMEGQFLRAADAVYSSSSYSAHWAGAVHGLDPARIPVMHAGIDVERFRAPAARPDGPPTVAFVGRVARSKGADVLVEAALRALRDVPDLRVLLAGRSEGDLATALAERVRRAGHAAAFEFLGAVPNDALPEILASADVFAAPSPCEGGPGFTCLEAMACGLPVIACAGTGVAEVVRPGATGALVGAGDTDELAAAIVALATDPAERRRLGAGGRALVEAEADARTCVPQIAAFLERVAAGAAERAFP